MRKYLVVALALIAVGLGTAPTFAGATHYRHGYRYYSYVPAPYRYGYRSYEYRGGEFRGGAGGGYTEPGTSEYYAYMHGFK